ncbi:MAG: hypothetical protein HOG49_35465 [Candidatus Scalindua sp.]|jgi:hypothetical protein|uniref:Uncharacterized protein n=1 Tax=uncultured marine virus TaxID=186617 RepID=A0A0F7L5K0_9VIRU|nr:hypothetical protein [uncultured marine virus]MBT6052132.1 hypothetical protein [Candidatus Scalindua sp.]
MTVTFTNIWWEKIIKIIRGFLDDEFKGVMAVYTGTKKPEGGQFIQIVPIGSTLVRQDATMETREYNLDVWFFFSDKNIKETSIKQVTRLISRVEALFHDNIVTSTYWDGSVDATEINVVEGGYEIKFSYSCKYAGNVG